MINFTITYPYDPEKSFDFDYYINTHVPLAKAILDPYVRKIHIERGLAGLEPNSPPAFYAIIHITYDSMEDLLASRNSPDAHKIHEDVQNFTNIVAFRQISEVLI